jgi:hypothetical protein
MVACGSGISKISILKDIYLENRFIYNKLDAILFEEMRRIDLLWEIYREIYGKFAFNFVALTFFLKA